MRLRVARWCSMVIVALSAALAGCPKELPKDLPPDELYRLGRTNFEDGHYAQAIEALERLLFQDPSHSKADSAQLLVAESHFKQGQYVSAASEFLRLAQNRPAGPLADDARYQACLSYVELSPRPELDQKYTHEAIDQCRSVVLLYPRSPFASEAQKRIDELTDKLARKEYLTADYYYQRRAYDSAIIYLEHLLDAYKGSDVEPQAMLKLYESYRKVGYAQEAQDIRRRLLAEYPDSPEAAEVRDLATDGVG